MKPVQPDFIPMPFAANGNKNTIPTEGTKGTADASYDEGFPQITEQPKELGGIPPQRKDFNGILNALSTLMFFAQSGGKYSYSDKVNYKTPCIVYHSGVLYWCLKENGPDTEVKEPTATNKAYWITLIEFLKSNADAVGIHIGGGVPIGTVITWPVAKNPSSDSGVWIDCDGRNISNYPKLVETIGQETAPDYRAMFLRGAGNKTIGNVTYSATVNSIQTDAIRNIVGGLPLPTHTGRWDNAVTGAFWTDGGNTSSGRQGADFPESWEWYDITRSGFDASRVVPTANENRPVNVGVRYLIKADD